jgi:hypothetical protein
MLNLFFHIHVDGRRKEWGNYKMKYSLGKVGDSYYKSSYEKEAVIKKEIN